MQIATSAYAGAHSIRTESAADRRVSRPPEDQPAKEATGPVSGTASPKAPPLESHRGQVLDIHA